MAEDSLKLVRREVVSSYRDRKVIREVWSDDRRPFQVHLVHEVIPSNHLVGGICGANIVTD